MARATLCLLCLLCLSVPNCLAQSAADLRAEGAAAEAAGQYDAASRAYEQVAKMYRDMGDPGAARVYETKAGFLATRVAIYREVPGGKPPKGLYTGAKYEPPYGAYIGAFIDDDDTLREGALSGRKAGSRELFVELVGKPHASYFNYFQYGTAFPTGWVNHLKEHGAAAQIAFEGANRRLPEKLDEAYLREYARAAKATGAAVFLRFAGEMNGDWIHYGAPQEYIAKFRFVHDIMEQEAPNVAMLWSPNCIPDRNLLDYYPGDAYTDWVGFSMYTVYCHNGNKAQPGDKEDPLQGLKRIYELFAARKPIMMSEYACSHYCGATQKDLTKFAVDRIRYVYHTLPRRYPRVKMISWYDRDNITHKSAPGRQINNYCITDNPQVLAAYKGAIAEPYYLPTVPLDKAPEIPPILREVADGEKLTGEIRLSAWAKAYVMAPKVRWLLDGKLLKATDVAPYDLTIDAAALAAGKHTLKVELYDTKGRVATAKAVTILTSTR